MPLPAGWYPVTGDPPGTHRYWDGDEFTTPAHNNPHARVSIRYGRAARTREISGLSTRGLAFLIDLLAPAVILGGLANATGIGLGAATNIGHLDYQAFLIANTIFGLVNHVVLGGIWGYTLGKKVMGLRLVREDDSKHAPGMVRALVRLLCWAIPGGVIVSALMLFYGQRKTINDVIAGTAVVYD